MRSVILLLLAFGTVVINLGVAAVDKKNFKTCDQSGFCKRLRFLKPQKSQYALKLDTAIVYGHTLSAEVNTVQINKEKEKKFLWHYILKLSALVDGTFRVELDEANPLYPRYKTQLALNGDPEKDQLKLLLNDTEKLMLSNTQGHKVIITAEPLKIEFINLSGETSVILNKNSQLFVEPLRVKQRTIKKESEEGALDPEDEGTWSENFNSHHDSKLRGNEAVSLDISFPFADHVYGLPEHTDKFHLATTTDAEPYRLYNLDVFEYELNSRMALYAAVPVLYSHGLKHSAGIFWHNSAETWVDIVNHPNSNVMSSLVNLVIGNDDIKQVDARFMSEAGILDIFVFLGEQPSDVFRQYTKLTGVTPLPPRFSLAYHQSRWNYVDEADIRGVDENFDVYDIPADSIWLDIEYTDNKKYFTWDVQKFRHPSEMVANLTAKGRKLIVIIDPHIKREAGYFLHEDATDNGYYVKDKDGKDYAGWCWPGSSSYLDFFNPEVSKYYSELFNFDKFSGTSKDVHIWNDMNEPSVFNGPEITMPKDNRHYKPIEDEHEDEGPIAYWEHRHVHNEYGLWHIRATQQGLLDRVKNKNRPFILTRSAFSGTQRYAAVWTGDNMADWGHLAITIPMCLSLSCAGISFCGADVGGFFKNPDTELITRWYQAAAYQPFFRAHSHIETKRREPWLYETTTTALLRDAIRRRYALIDFWYTLFYEHSIDGLPVMRPLFQEFPKEKETYTIDNAYLLGNKLLIHPVVEPGVKSVEVYLPGRESNTLWYDVDSCQVFKGNGYLNVGVNIAKVPIYQRGGTVLPRKERVRRSSSLMVDDPYTLVIALDVNNTAQGSLYIDDGETYEYQDNKFIYAKFNYVPSQLTYSFLNIEAVYLTRSWVERIVIMGVKIPPKTATLHQGDKQNALQMTLHKGNNVLVVRKPGADMSKPWKILYNY